MPQISINIENIGKCYYRRGTKSSTDAREALTEISKRIFATNRTEAEPFWALRNISLEIEQGEVIGLIGSNGAGKSTLLKILSRITYPTEGSAVIRGRIGSLLEAGTGFHSELTGRENIFMSGLILGMTSHEVKSTFDDIVEFSGVENFLDTPVKRYSSGMALRLAFSVAAHLQTEILIVDEVLAVGDEDFRKKSLDKMRSITKDGRTVIFVSHNMDSIRNLCSKALYLDHGKVIDYCSAGDAADRYLRNCGKS